MFLYLATVEHVIASRYEDFALFQERLARRAAPSSATPQQLAILPVILSGAVSRQDRTD